MDETFCCDVDAAHTLYRCAVGRVRTCPTGDPKQLIDALTEVRAASRVLGAVRRTNRCHGTLPHTHREPTM